MKYAYNEIFNNKKEKTTDNCYNKDKPQGIMLSEKSQAQNSIYLKCPKNVNL